jgi:murein DD-endopeptidase MepM/ murein hydrolase activator NlpD
MSRFTVIVVPDETTDQVRRFRVSRRWLPHLAAATALTTLLGLALVVDWVRLRRDALEVEEIRAESAAHQRDLDALGVQVSSLEQEFGRLRELERKVRVIANLPGAILEAQVPEELGAGQGGGEEAAPDVGEGPDVAAPGEDAPAPTGPAGGGERADAPGALPLDAAALARVSRKASRIGGAVDARLRSFEALVEGLEGKQHRLASTPSIWPADGWVTSRYGYRTSPFTGRRQFHGGLDIAADFGTPVLAPARGRVVFAGRKGPLGQTVVLDHGYGLRTIFGHAAELYVKRGQTVERGARIASVGSSGRSTGPHLHYAIAVDGESVDPADYIFE